MSKLPGANDGVTELLTVRLEVPVKSKLPAPLASVPIPKCVIVEPVAPHAGNVIAASLSVTPAVCVH